MFLPNEKGGTENLILKGYSSQLSKNPRYTQDRGMVLWQSDLRYKVLSMKKGILALLLLFCSITTAAAQQGGQPNEEKSSDCDGQKTSSGDCITPPRPTHSPDPVYPVKERNTGHEGSVGILLAVDTEGVPHDITVSRSLSPAFDAAALEAVRAWKFAPATKNGKPIMAKIDLHVEFHAISRR